MPEVEVDANCWPCPKLPIIAEEKKETRDAAARDAAAKDGARDGENRAVLAVFTLFPAYIPIGAHRLTKQATKASWEIRLLSTCLQGTYLPRVR